MKRLSGFIAIALILLSSCGLDFSTETKYISVYNNSSSILLISMEPFQSANNYRQIPSNEHTAWVYETEDSCTLYISSYTGDIIIVDGTMMLDSNGIHHIGEYMFVPGMNATDISINENYEVEIKKR